MPMAHIAILERFNHAGRPRVHLPGDPERREVPAETLDLIAVNEERPIVADLHDRVEPLAGMPNKSPGLLERRESLPRFPVDEQIGVVLPRRLAFPAKPTVVTVNLPAMHLLKRREIKP